MERSELVETAKRLGKLEDTVSRRKVLQAVSYLVFTLTTIACTIAQFEIIINSFNGGGEIFAGIGFVVVGNVCFVINNVRSLEKTREQIKLLQEKFGMSEKIKNDNSEVKMSSWTLGDDGELVELGIEDNLYLNNHG